jgi:hypothetical protein
MRSSLLLGYETEVMAESYCRNHVHVLAVMADIRLVCETVRSQSGRKPYIKHSHVEF